MMLSKQQNDRVKKRKRSEVENEVLGTYRKVSPSKTLLDTKQQFVRFYQRRMRTLSSLKLTDDNFRGKTLLDIGGGTGEKDLVYAGFGADVTIIDPNEKSLERATDLFKKHGLKCKTIQKSLFEIKPKMIQNYDVVVCDGVLHHTFNPKKALSIIISNLKQNALVIIGISESHGWFKRNLQKKLIRKLANNDEKGIIFYARKYFRDHLDRAIKIGLRDEMSVIYDSYINKHQYPMTLREVCDVFKTNKVRHYSSYPSLEPFYKVDSWSEDTPDLFDYDFYRDYYGILEKLWMTAVKISLVIFLEF